MEGFQITKQSQKNLHNEISSTPSRFMEINRLF